MGSHPFNFNPPSAHRHANTRAFPRNITISVRETITLSLGPSTLHRCVASLFREHSLSSRFFSLSLSLPPHQHILQPNALYASSARPTSPLSPSLSTCAFSSSFSPPTISPSSTCNHARIIFTHSHTRAAHKTSRVTFYPSQVHTLSLTAFECCSSHARQQGGLSAPPFFLPRSPSRSIFAHRFIVCLPRSSRSHSRHGRGRLSVLFVARTIRGTGAPFISVTRSFYLSTWPTHRNKFHPPTLPFTHFSPADHPLRIEKQAIRLSRRSIFRRPADRPIVRPKKGDKGAFLFPLPDPIGYIAAAISNNNYTRVIVKFTD